MRSKNARKNREVNDRTGKLITHYFFINPFLRHPVPCHPPARISGALKHNSTPDIRARSVSVCSFWPAGHTLFHFSVYFQVNFLLRFLYSNKLDSAPWPSPIWTVCSIWDKLSRRAEHDFLRRLRARGGWKNLCNMQCRSHRLTDGCACPIGWIHNKSALNSTLLLNEIRLIHRKDRRFYHCALPDRALYPLS